MLRMDPFSVSHQVFLQLPLGDLGAVLLPFPQLAGDILGGDMFAQRGGDHRVCLQGVDGGLQCAGQPEQPVEAAQPVETAEKAETAEHAEQAETAEQPTGQQPEQDPAPEQDAPEATE